MRFYEIFITGGLGIAILACLNRWNVTIEMIEQSATFRVSAREKTKK